MLKRISCFGLTLALMMVTTVGWTQEQRPVTRTEDQQAQGQRSATRTRSQRTPAQHPVRRTRYQRTPAQHPVRRTRYQRTPAQRAVRQTQYQQAQSQGAGSQAQYQQTPNQRTVRQTQYQQAQNRNQRLLGLKNVQFEVRLLSPISTETSKKGDTFSTQILSPPSFNGAIIVGKITKVRRAKHRKKAEIRFVFERLTQRGQSYPIQADLRDVANSKGIKNVDEEGQVIGRSSHKKQLASAAVGAGVGALIGGLLAGPKGAAMGAGMGAAAGLVFAVSFTTSGSQIDFGPGSTFTLLVSDRGR